MAYTGSKTPERGDIVVFSPNDNSEGDDLLKRVIGLPGETIEVKDGYVYIDGVALEENYILEQPNYFFAEVTVPENCYFMMGDNRNMSRDSHAWDNPFVPMENIKGKAVCCYWPFSRMGSLYGD